MNMEQTFCQSCGMPMGADESMWGTEANGSQSAHYCKYCYEAGAFTYPCTMDEMIETCVPPMLEAHPEMSADEARTMMKAFLPSLKRWKKDA